MKSIILMVLSVFAFIIFSSISVNSFADIDPMDDAQQYRSGGQDLDIVAFKKQLEAMEETIKKQQEMINVLKDKIETKEKVAEISNPTNMEENEIERIVDDYLMKDETRKKLVPNSIREPTDAGLTRSPYSLQAFWDKGLRLESENGNFKLKLGGRMFNDWGWLTEDKDVLESIGDQIDGTIFRTVRLYLSGEIYENIGFKVAYDFGSGGGRPSFTDVYMELKKIPVLGNFRVGHFKEPFSLEELTSSRFVTFMERSLNNAFAPKRNTGFMLYNNLLDKRMTWAAGVFRNADVFGDSQGDRSTEGGYSFSGRITGLPYYEDKGTKLIHTGFSYAYKNAFENEFSFDSHPEIRLADDFVDTGSFKADLANLINPELAIVYGPFSLQTEYTFADINRKRSTTGSNVFTGFYVYGSYFLTGEHRKYETKKGAFGRVIPNKNFYWGKGMGAIELTARYSELDLSDRDIDGGRLQDLTLGINWYLNPNTRVMLNYVRANVDRLVSSVRLDDANADLLSMRFQIDF
jgi:phosphate-selective porin OprO/OprP